MNTVDRASMYVRERRWSDVEERDCFEFMTAVLEKHRDDGGDGGMDGSFEK